ncbi:MULTISPECIES: anti-sigma factor [unclassified Pseudomonas]|uniref:anti-sigma factor family protein n=1 Tax=unclassified Pseudomonas TaxID=196821 RepID=UPI002AC8DDA4|nr:MULTISPECIES: anti-sigma factor [unclassified Pseudomonas]MEB0047819.1 anti-sigma factor [Pseudomonas sp. Dout3]MEB0098333.1 anti-sigma factor [Pseudomonas sp. DC1.2]WPX57121.1 anti-sigma factor [Pseudomonas sp. DC1.2]
MNELDCTVCQTLIHGYLDQELDSPKATKVAEHLAGCVECARLHDEERLLIAGVKRQVPYYPAPTTLTASVLEQTKARTRPFARVRRWLAPAFSATALAFAVMLYVAMPPGDQPLMEEAVSSHVRSLMGEHLNDVVSSDRHTVKPWFTGKLDFSPPVFDYSAQGFPLLGGRLDYLQHQTTAALAYGRAKHIINVFILPTASADKPRQSQLIRGFNVVSWQQHQMRFVVVSDLEKSELETFSQLLEKGD